MALTKYNYNSFDVTPVASQAMGFNSGANGLAAISSSSQVLIKTVTASSDATVSFVNGTDDVVFDGTYPIYKFVFINIHPATDGARLVFQVDTGTNTSYNITCTSTYFYCYHDEADTSAAVAYVAGRDQAQGTAFQNISDPIGNGNDENGSGELYIFAPSSSTFVKHFIGRTNIYHNDNQSVDNYSAGYFNTTTALTRVQFKMHSGNVDAGTIKLYGIKDS